MRSSDLNQPQGLFCYGTLQEDRVMQAVTGKTFAPSPAMLIGYRRRRILKEDYPGILPDPASSVDGLLMRDIDAVSLKHLDAFEGDYYERMAVPVKTLDGTVSAWAYVIRADHSHLMSEELWSLERFRVHFLQRFMFTYPNF